MSQAQRVPPPHDLDTEAAVCAMALDGDGVALAAIRSWLPPEAFYDVKHTRIAQAIVGLGEEGKPVDAVTAAAWLKARGQIGEVGGIAGIEAVVSAAASTTCVDTYARHALVLWQLRRMRDACERVAASIRQGAVEDARALLDGARAEVSAIAEAETTSSSAGTLASAVRDAFGAIQENANGGRSMAGISTGFESLDSVVGGFRPGQLWVLAARPGAGKSSMARALTVNVAGGVGDGPACRSAMLFTPEMTREEVALALVCTEAAVDSNALRGGAGAIDWPALTQAAAWLSQSSVMVDDTAGIFLADLRSKATRYAADMRAAGTPLALVVVDYLQLVRVPSRKNSVREQDVSEVARGLKNLAKELGCTVLALAQLNREVEKREGPPRLSDLRESGEIEQAADGILFLHPRDQWTGAVVAKNRGGPTGTVPLRWEPRFTRFSGFASDEVPPEYDHPADKRWAPRGTR